MARPQRVRRVAAPVRLLRMTRLIAEGVLTLFAFLFLVTALWVITPP